MIRQQLREGGCAVGPQLVFSQHKDDRGSHTETMDGLLDRQDDRVALQGEVGNTASHQLPSKAAGTHYERPQRSHRSQIISKNNTTPCISGTAHETSVGLGCLHVSVRVSHRPPRPPRPRPPSHKPECTECLNVLDVSRRLDVEEKTVDVVLYI